MYGVADLQTFVAVARGANVTAAARRLGISTATASHRIAKLERALNVTLFRRNSRAVALTDEGRLFFERVEGVLADLAQAEEDVGGGAAPLRGQLRATLSPWILSRFIMPRLGAFRAAHPELTLTFLSVDRFVSLAEEGQDCAIRVGALADSALRAFKLCDTDRVICASPSFIAQHGPFGCLEALSDAPWLSSPWQTRVDLTDAAGRRRTIRLARMIEVSSADMLTEGAAQGLGLAVKSRLAIGAELAAGDLVEVAAGRLHAPDAPIWFVQSPEARVDRKVEAFRGLAQAAFAGLGRSAR